MKAREFWPNAWRGIVLVGVVFLVLIGATSYVGWQHGIWPEVGDFLVDHQRRVELLLAIVALLFAVIQWRHMVKAHHRLESIAGQISTIFTGSFPRHLKTIAEIVSSADLSIDVLADCVDYGSFFDPEGHEKVFKTVARAVLDRDIKVRVLVCGTPQPITHNSPFFGKNLGESLDDVEFCRYLKNYIEFVERDEDFKKWARTLATETSQLRWIEGCMKSLTGSVPSKSFDERLNRCLFVCSGNEKFKETDSEAFSTLLLLRQMWFGERLKCIGVKVLEQPKHEAVYLWIKDKGFDALFVFADSGETEIRKGADLELTIQTF